MLLQRIYRRCSSTSAIRLHELLCDSHPSDDIALVSGPEVKDLTFGELREKSLRLGTVLKEQGVRKGDRLGIMLPKREEYFVGCLAAARVGATVLPLFTAFEEQATTTRTSAATPTAIITTDANREKFRKTDSKYITITDGKALTHSSDIVYEDATSASGELAATDHSLFDPTDPMAMIFTSGTTGAPKGVPVPVRALNSFQTYLRTGLGVTPSDNYWNIADPGWAYGLYYALYAPLSLGYTSRFLNTPFGTKSTLDFISQQKVTHFAAAPTVYRSLKKDGVGEYANNLDEAFCLRCVSSAGEPLTPAVGEWFRENFKADILNHYGQSENGMMCLYPHIHHNDPNYMKSDDAVAASMGPSMHGFQMVVLNSDHEEASEGEVGELAIDMSKSPDFWFTGYFNRDPLLGVGEGNKYYCTGDRGFFKNVASKHFIYEGRKDDLITTAGYRVGPSDIEDCVMQLPFVHECAAVGIPHPVKGHSIKVFIVVTGGAHCPSDPLAAVRDHVKRNLAKHIVPSEVEVIASLPKTDSGKIKRYELRG